MPPVSSPQGSRTALITWSVVFAILWVTASIIAIWAYANMSKAELKYDTEIKKSIPDIVSEADLSSEAVRKLKEARNQEGSGLNPSMSVFQAAMAKLDHASQLIAGAGGKDTASQVAADALKSAAAVAKQANLSIPAEDNLAAAVTVLSDALKSSMAKEKNTQAALDASKKGRADDAAELDKRRKKMDDETAAVRAELAAKQDELAKYQATKDASVGEIEKGRELERTAAGEKESKGQVRIAQLERDVASAKQQIETLQAKFADKRVNTVDPITRHPDGKIIRIPAKDVVYIDLGQEDSVTPGLTFEVYDHIDGIPPAGDPTNDDNLPRGKASIEIVRVGAGSSECRVTRQTLGTQISEGDLVANLVYDRNVKYNFVVFGDFDMDRNGVATPQDAEVIKRLITQWGGKIADAVNVDTDFVVLGKEPILPTFSKDELQDPFNAKKLADAQAALDAYQAVKTTAQNLHIPIVNQNRFLYLIGYFNQAKR